MTDLQARDLVLVLLPRGRDRAIPLGELAESLRLTRREVEKACQSIACEGSWPVVAGPEGVWIATAPSEVDAYLLSLRHRALEIFRRYRGVKRARSAMAPVVQEEIWPVAS